MEAGPKFTPAELRIRVLELQRKKVQEEETLKVAFQDLVQSVSPVQIVKSSLHKLSEDRQVKIDLKRVGMTMGVNIILRTFFGRNRNIKVYMAAVAIEKIAIPFIKENWPLVEALARRFTGPSPESDDGRQDDREDIRPHEAETFVHAPQAVQDN